jgi:hypothetical protein
MPKFPRRQNQDGSIDSICTKCFRTVANGQTEAYLLEQEKHHSCRVRDLHHIQHHQSHAKIAASHHVA